MALLDVRCFSQIADTPERIAIRFDVTVDQIIKYNPGLVPNKVIPLHTEIIIATSDDIPKKTRKKSPVEKIKSTGKKVNKCK